MIPNAERVADGARTQASSYSSPAMLTASEWAGQCYAQVDLGDQRLNRRAVEMAAHPEASLPSQMQSPSTLEAAYGLLNNDRVTLEGLLTPIWRQTLAMAGQFSLVLMAQDTTELDYTAHPSKTGLGPIGDGSQSGLLLHTTLAIEPERREVLGLAHTQSVLRQPTPTPPRQWMRTPEGRLWEVSAMAVGSAPEGVTWVHVSDRGSDIYEYMAVCVQSHKHFLVRAKQNRALSWDEGDPQSTAEEARLLLNYARSQLPHPGASYTVHVPPSKKQPAREAQVVLSWSTIRIPPLSQAPEEVRRHGLIEAWLLRVWEPQAPTGVDPVEWILISSLPVLTTADAYRTVDWYCCRWLVEDYHQCLKTGCRVEHTQLDDGADICRLLGFAVPIAVRLLQLRQYARQSSELPAQAVVEPLMVEVLARRQKKNAKSMTISEFWRAIARLGGHQGRQSDGPAGWRTVWKGWRYLSDLTEGARLFSQDSTQCEKMWLKIRVGRPRRADIPEATPRSSEDLGSWTRWQVKLDKIAG